MAHQTIRRLLGRSMAREGVLIFSLFLLLATLLALLASAQERITDEVAVTIGPHEVFAATAREGLARVELIAGEDVLVVEARGLNALVATSRRFLGFSAEVPRWAEQPRTGTLKTILGRHVMPRFILVQTDKRLLGFQSAIGSWTVEGLHPGEVVNQVHARDHVAVVVTNRRALGFSAFTGGFFSQDLPRNEVVNTITVNDNIVIISTKKHRLIFRSQLAAWMELLVE